MKAVFLFERSGIAATKFRKMNLIPTPPPAPIKKSYNVKLTVINVGTRHAISSLYKTQNFDPAHNSLAVIQSIYSSIGRQHNTSMLKGFTGSSIPKFQSGSFYKDLPCWKRICFHFVVSIHLWVQAAMLQSDRRFMVEQKLGVPRHLIALLANTRASCRSDTHGKGEFIIPLTG